MTLFIYPETIKVDGRITVDRKETFNPIFKPINQHGHKGEKNSVSTAGTNRGQFQTEAVWGTNSISNFLKSCEMSVTQSPTQSTLSILHIVDELDRNHLPSLYSHRYISIFYE